MKYQAITIIMLAITVVPAGIGLAEGNTDQDKRADKAVYNRLTGEIRRANAEYTRNYNRAVNEARNNDGKALAKTKAKIVALRDEVDRKTTRLLMVSLRHGWEVPNLAAETSTASSGSIAADYKKQMFAAIDGKIQETLTGEAVKLAAGVHLPVISINISTSGDRKDG